MIETQKNAHARFSIIGMCTAVLGAQKSFLGQSSACVHKILWCANMCGSHTPSFFSRRISRRILLDAQTSVSHLSNRKNRTIKNNVFCEFPNKVPHTAWADFWRNMLVFHTTRMTNRFGVASHTWGLLVPPKPPCKQIGENGRSVQASHTALAVWV